jgi:hypothetical protein
MRQRHWPELYQAAAPAAALAISLAMASIVKVRVASSVLGAPVSVWRWSLLSAALIAAMVGYVATRGPEWSELVFGIPAILLTYGWIIWRFGFGEEDRTLFRKANPAGS